MEKLSIDNSNMIPLFDQFPILKKIGNDDRFDEKLWILIKGIKAGTGEPILISSIGHNPCHAMLKRGITDEEIEFDLKQLLDAQLIEFPDGSITKSMRRFVVTGGTALELNKLLFNFDLFKFLGNRGECQNILVNMGFDSDRNSLDNLTQKGKNAWFWLNDSNGVATAKLLKTILLNELPNLVQKLSEHAND